MPAPQTQVKIANITPQLPLSAVQAGINYDVSALALPLAQQAQIDKLKQLQA